MIRLNPRTRDPEAPRSAIAAVLSMLALLGFLAASWLLLLRGSAPPAADALDASWSAVLGWAGVTGAQWGNELAFTYGPLGFLVPGASYLPDGADRYWLGQLLLTLATCAVLAWVYWRLDVPLRVALVATVWIGSPWMAGDVLWLVTVAALLPMIASACRHRPQLALPVALLAGLYASVLSLLKFNLFPLLLIYWLLASAMLWQDDRRKGLAILLAIPVIWLTVWLALGQSAAAIGDYLDQSWELSAGYGAAMSKSAGPRLDWSAAGWFAMTSAMVGWLLVSGRSAWAERAPLLMVLAILALAWKWIITRVIPEKLALVFPLLALLLLVACCIGAPGRMQRRFALLAVTLLTIAIVASSSLPTWAVVQGFQRSNVGAALDQLTDRAAATEAMQQQWRDQVARHRLPIVAGLVAGRSIDMVSHSQGIVLLNGFNYAPRPVFQGYAAYTPALTRLNERHLLGPDAPDFVLVSVAGIDGSFFSAEDPLTLLALLGRYDLAASERGFALLARSSRTPAPLAEPAIAAWRTHRMDQFVELPARPAGQSTIAHLRVELSMSGRVRAATLREPRLVMDIRTGDGIVHSGGILRPNAATGLLIDPLLLNTADLARALAGFPPDELTGDLREVRVRPADPADAGRFQGEVQWAFSHQPLPPGAPSAPGPGVVDLVYPGFSQAPVAQGGNIQLREAGGERIVFMHSPSWLEFQLEPGTWQLSARAGIVQDVAESQDCSQADGVGVVFEASGPSPGAGPWLDVQIPPPTPRRGTAGAPPAQLVAHASVTEPTRARLRIDPGVRGNLVCDWAYIRDVQIKGVMPENSFGFERVP